MYTIIDGSHIERDQTVEEAAEYLLRDDSAEYEIRRDKDGNGWSLWTRKQVANKPWTKTVIFSLEANEDVARADILRRVLESGHWETDNINVMTDADYDAMQEG